MLDLYEDHDNICKGYVINAAKIAKRKSFSTM